MNYTKGIVDKYFISAYFLVEALKLVKAYQFCFPNHISEQFFFLKLQFLVFNFNSNHSYIDGRTGKCEHLQPR